MEQMEESVRNVRLLTDDEVLIVEGLVKTSADIVWPVPQ